MDFRELDKLNWRLHLSNNNNIVNYSANRHRGPDAAEERRPELLVSQVNCGTGVKTMGTNQKRAATTSAQAVAVDEQVVVAGGNGATTAEECPAATMAAEDGDKVESASYCELDLDVASYGLAAAALSSFEAAACGYNSSRTSINNSTENLSYASDNFYGDDLILLDDNDVNAEEISINYDDCVYAYRGEGADFDMNMEIIATGRVAGQHFDLGRGPVNTMGGDSLICGEDETEFLEMDFEPDPSSELELVGGTHDMTILPHANLLLMQRDYSQMNSIGGTTSTQEGQLHSSPIDDFPQDDLMQQQKLRLSKKFARISLNLDKIKDVGAGGSGVDIDLNEQIVIDSEKRAESSGSFQAHSLPNPLHTGSNFSRSTSVTSEHPEPKMTGAKPKRFLHTSSVMTKSSSYKSRRSHPSASFDERCYSCTDFRATTCQQQQSGSKSKQDQVAPILVTPATVGTLTTSSSCTAQFDLGITEENCLDCLEKEFLANTIGKVVDPGTCPKCRRSAGSRGSSISLYSRSDQVRCRSGSPVYFDGGPFAGWHSLSATGIVSGSNLGPPCNQRFISCDNSFNGLQLLNQGYLTEPLVASLSTGKTCDEEHLVQALDKLRVPYDRELLHGYFKQLAKRRRTESSVNLKQLLIQASKQQGNHRKLKRLIEMATHQQLIVQFKRKAGGKTELVPINVRDILNAWARCRDLSLLQQLDDRFHCANVMGRVGHIVRQATVAASTQAQASSSTSFCKRTLPEYLMIPQYYMSGVLTLTRKC
ncbi:uncharacterized protein LOC6733120 [Drosophila simulans]|uniref:GD24347 n=1 Tax=Drosophila simulans TaxID=7240 RepID=B4Q4W0_DROSI|nr:uncharacterized protein LOC6733120 [Drosophila simulans]EDX05782.1 GD24347 [Drosophila simulans]KMY91419.1 uncharacterized protein Dsimw501_GD24347 [Drosophila simulans]